MLSNNEIPTAADFPLQALSSFSLHTSSDRKLLPRSSVSDVLPLGAFCEFSSATGLARGWSPSHHWSPVALGSLLRSFSHGKWHRCGQFLCEPHCEQGQEALLCDKIQSHHFWVLTWGLYHPPSAARLSPAISNNSLDFTLYGPNGQVHSITAV